MNTVPLQFLVGVTRLIAIYFGFTALEQLAAAAAYYATVKLHAASPMTQQLPDALDMYLPGLVCSLILAIGTWFAAPYVCRLALASKDTQPAEPDTTLAWNEVMIFLTGVLFVGWGLTRLESALMPILKLKAQGVNRELAMVEQIGFFVTATIIGFGGIMMSRFASIYRWMQKRKLWTVKTTGAGSALG